MEKKRCFIAVDLPKDCIKKLQQLQEELKKQNLFLGKYTEPENIHLTLKFLGEIDDEKIAQVKACLQKVEFIKFPMAIKEMGVFSEQYIRIIWVQVHGKEIYDLQKKIDAALKDVFPPERRFMGHITIARVKKVENKKEVLDYVKKSKGKEATCTIDRFTLKQSVLTPEKPVYSVLQEYSCRNL